MANLINIYITLILIFNFKNRFFIIIKHFYIYIDLKTKNLSYY